MGFSTSRKKKDTDCTAENWCYQAHNENYVLTVQQINYYYYYYYYYYYSFFKFVTAVFTNFTNM